MPLDLLRQRDGYQRSSYPFSRNRNGNAANWVLIFLGNREASAGDKSGSIPLLHYFIESRQQKAPAEAGASGVGEERKLPLTSPLR